MNLDSTPTTPCAQAARFIWEEQDKLNAVCHPAGTGTIDRQGTRPQQERDALDFDYWLALHDEITELIRNFFWKHWSREARAGRRFLLTRQAETNGDGTVQNVTVELIDIVFFTVSLLQVRDDSAGLKRATWMELWGREEAWSQVRREVGEQAGGDGSTQRLLDPANNRYFLLQLKGFEANLTRGQQVRPDDVLAVFYLMKLFAAAGITWEQALNLYRQKLAVNYERQARGRQQVGDILAHAENAAVEVK